MQAIKTTLSLVIVLLLCSAPAFAQEMTKLEQRAADQVETLNQRIIAGDETAAITPEQREQMQAIFVTMFKDIRTTRKAGGDDVEEQLKAIRKEAYGEVFKSVLTKEQRLANKEGKKKG